MTITDADRLANEPPVLVLSDGRKLPVQFGYGGLRRIEKRFGSLQNLMRQMEANLQGEVFDAVLGGLHCGLWKTGITEAELEDVLDSRQIDQHSELLLGAITQSFPQQAQEEARKAQAEVEAETVPTGPAFTTSQPSYVDVMTTSSGT